MGRIGARERIIDLKMQCVKTGVGMVRELSTHQKTKIGDYVKQGIFSKMINAGLVEAGARVPRKIMTKAYILLRAPR